MVNCMPFDVCSLQGSPSLTLTRRYRTDRFYIAPVLRSCVFLTVWVVNGSCLAIIDTLPQIHMDRMILVPGFIFYGFLYFQWSWISLVCLWDRCILFTNSLLCMNVSRFWACPCPNTTFGQVLQVPVRWQCPFAWGLPVIKNWVMEYSPFNCYP